MKNKLFIAVLSHNITSKLHLIENVVKKNINLNETKQFKFTAQERLNNIILTKDNYGNKYFDKPQRNYKIK